MKKVAISFILFSIFVASCTKINDTVPLKSSEPESLPAGYLTVDDAVANLNNFLSAVQGPATKSGDERKIKSVEAHYDNTVLTRSGESVPDAYLVTAALQAQSSHLASVGGRNICNDASHHNVLDGVAIRTRHGRNLLTEEAAPFIYLGFIAAGLAAIFQFPGHLFHKTY